MIIKFSKIISCSSEDPSYPANNLLEYKPSKDSSTWRCERPGILESELILELAEPAPVTGVDIGNYRCCSVKISGATNSEPDKWLTIIEHEFMSRNDAEDGRFKDQVKLFTKKELDEEMVKIVFSRVKVTCMQPANPRVTFGLTFLIFRTEDKTDTGNLDIFGRFKVKKNEDVSLDKFKEKYIQQIRPKGSANFKTEIVKQIEINRANLFNEKIDDASSTRKRPSLNLNRDSPDRENSTNETEGKKAEKTEEADSAHRPIKRVKVSEKDGKEGRNSLSDLNKAGNSRESSQKDEEEKIPDTILSKDTIRARARCSLCLGNEENVLCKTCNLLRPENKVEEKKGKGKETPKRKAARPVAKPTKDFAKFFEGVAFSLSGYKNPERDDIRRQAIAMGAKYVFDTDRRNHGCTHLVCAFKNTPKYNQLRGSVKIVSHSWVEDSYKKKTRFPWRRYALDSNDRNKPESEDEIEASTGPAKPPSVYDEDTDSDC